MYKRGEVVLVPFPFSDLSSVKTRPAVVVSVEDLQRDTGNLIVAMITWVEHKTRFDCEIHDWQSAKLVSPSWVRAKLATIEQGLVRYQPGSLTHTDLSEVETKIRIALALH
jgi:mRNA interferase MazF